MGWDFLRERERERTGHGRTHAAHSTDLDFRTATMPDADTNSPTAPTVANEETHLGYDPIFDEIPGLRTVSSVQLGPSERARMVGDPSYWKKVSIIVANFW